MNRDTAKTLREELVQHRSIDTVTIFYVDSPERVYSWEDRYDPNPTADFGVEIECSRSTLDPDALAVLSEVGVSITNSITTQGLFRTVP